MGSLDQLGGATHEQLTIFYSGKVNVYDDVPADKAHAIMLLLSGCSMNIRGSVSCRSTCSDQAFVADGDDDQLKREEKKLDPSMSIVVGPSSPAAPNAGANSSTIALQFQRKQQNRTPTSRRSQAELPFARKASLARFLEKRKDRVEAMRVSGSVDADACESPASCKRRG